MNAGVQVLPLARPRVLDYVALAKPRVTVLVVLTALLGFVIAPGSVVDWVLLVYTVVGTALAAAGASALNMVMERETDGRMRRTRNRPLPAGRLHPSEATWFGVGAAVTGVAWLALVNPLTAAVGALTIVTYLFVYTPLKFKTSFCTVVGAVPGALPPVIGWTAATGSAGAGAVALFAILFIWQLPHFLAIGWMYREDYARAGCPMLPVQDPDGAVTGRQVVLQSLALISVSLLPVVVGLADATYMAGALALGGGFAALSGHFALARTDARARRLFVGSIVYLPILLTLLAVSRL
ncbi:MAG: protoheme IX farnesyltransferase [Planctomycetes bacterium]|nr:protoheme IX farnesyltransferase [Planctomycetota bacterium]